MTQFRDDLPDQIFFLKHVGATYNFIYIEKSKGREVNSQPQHTQKHKTTSTVNCNAVLLVVDRLVATRQPFILWMEWYVLHCNENLYNGGRVASKCQNLAYRAVFLRNSDIFLSSPSILSMPLKYYVALQEDNLWDS